MQKLRSIALLLIAASFELNVLPALSCTDFVVQPKDGSQIVGRSMEWGVNLDSQVWKHARGEERVSQTPAGKAGVAWRSKYGYLALDANHMPVTIDGMNEKGLSVGLLWMPGSAYQDVTSARAEDVLNLVDLSDWLLGNFSTVDEVKTAIATVKVWAPELAEWGGVPAAHLAIHDCSGNSAVIEFVDGQQHIYDNPAGVLTNAPTFSYQPRANSNCHMSESKVQNS